MSAYPTRKEIWAWASYDFANSAYALVPVLLFPLYYKSIILDNSPNADLWWGIAIGTSILLSGILSPVIGAYADLSNKRKLVFVGSSLIAIIGTATLAVTSHLIPLVGTFIFIVTNMMLNIALTLYDSLLFNVSAQNNSGRVSCFGWALGYVGGVICTLLLYPFLKEGVEAPLYWLTFIIVALFFLIFAFPAFRYIREREIAPKEKIKNPLREGFTNAFSTIKNWRVHKHLFIFLLAFYFLTEGIVTIMFFFSLYANTTLHLPTSKIGIMLILAQIIAVPATLLVAKYHQTIGYKKTMVITLIGWILATVFLIFAKSIGMLYIFIIIASLVMGGSQAIARAWYTSILPPSKRAELFGFNALASKISSTIGPPLFGVLSVFTGSQRIAVASILVYFLISLTIFFKMKE